MNLSIPLAKGRLRRRRWLVIGLVALVAVVGGGSWLLFRPESATARSITATVARGEVTRTVAASGTLEPVDSETLSFDVSGTVTKVLVELGDTVTKGQALARIDRDLLDAQLKAAESTFAAAADDVDDASGAVALAAAQAQLATARDDLAAARQAVRDAVLRAPFAGQVVSLDLAVGDVVGSSGGGSSASTTTVPGSTSRSSSDGTITLASVDAFQLEATVTSTDLASISTGLQVEVTATGVDDTLYGTVTEVGRVATTTNSGSAAFPVTIELTGETEGVYGGTSATAQIIVEKRSDVLTVPTRAVHSEGETTYVDLVATDGSTTKQPIEIGETYGSLTEVLKGLDVGDTIQLAALPAGMPGGGRSGQDPTQGDFPGGGYPGGGFPGGELPAGGFPGGFPGGGQ